LRGGTDIDVRANVLLVEHGAPISYLVLGDGTGVFASDDARVGEVKRVLAIPDEDIFDGVILATDEGERFVDSESIDEIYQRGVVLKLDSDEARYLPEPTKNPATLEPTLDDVAGDTPGDKIHYRIRQVWDRISGNY
jgi:hypothetical protein